MKYIFFLIFTIIAMLLRLTWFLILSIIYFIRAIINITWHLKIDKEIFRDILMRWVWESDNECFYLFSFKTHQVTPFTYLKKTYLLCLNIFEIKKQGQ